MMKTRLVPLLLALLPALTIVRDAAAAEYQFSVATDDRDGRAFLWVPPTCRHVRGILLAKQVILEARACEDPAIRRACADSGLAIVILFRGPLGEFHYHRDEPRQKVVDQVRALAGENDLDVEVRPGPPPPERRRTPPDAALQHTLDELAAASGYDEIASAPLLTLGHSGGAIFAWNVAYCWPGRALGVIGLHSAAIFPPYWDPKASPAEVPALCISGEYESWGNPAEPLDRHWRWLRGNVLDLRGHYDAPAHEIVQPGAGHFNWDERLAGYVALFIEKVARYRLPPADEAQSPATQPSATQSLATQSSATKPAALRPLAIESGWLTDVNLLSASRFAPAARAHFAADPSLAFWHMDRELAEAADRFAGAYGGPRDQRVTLVQDGRPLPAAWIEPVKFQPLEDGVSVRLAADFLDRTPQGVAGAGAPLGHGPGPIRFRLIGGWGGGGEQTGPDTFRIRFDHFGTGRACCNLQVMAYADGDGTWKYAEQPCQIEFPEKNLRGRPQRITFPKVPDVGPETALVPLNATSDCGLPVRYFVRSGPAEVDGARLRLTPVPPRCRLPVAVTVVAYQWGRPTEPLVQTAEPVEQTFFLRAGQAH